MIQQIDFKILDWIQLNCRNAFLDALMPKITLLGEMGMLWIVLAIVFLLWKPYRKWGITLSVGLICSLLVGNVFLKHLVARDRPCWINIDIQMLVAIPNDYSFPSGHTLASFISSVILLHYDKRIGIPALVISIAIAFSRMYLYVHFPTDVLAGMVLGIAIGSAVAYCMDRVVFERNKQKL